MLLLLLLLVPKHDFFVENAGSFWQTAAAATAAAVPKWWRQNIPAAAVASKSKPPLGKTGSGALAPPPPAVPSNRTERTTKGKDHGSLGREKAKAQDGPALKQTAAFNTPPPTPPHHRRTPVDERTVLTVHGQPRHHPPQLSPTRSARQREIPRKSLLENDRSSSSRRTDVSKKQTA